MASKNEVSVTVTLLALIAGNEGITYNSLVSAALLAHPTMTPTEIGDALAKAVTDHVIFRHGEPIVTAKGNLAFVGKNAGYFSKPDTKIVQRKVAATPEQVQAARMHRMSESQAKIERANAKAKAVSSNARLQDAQALLKARGYTV